MTIPARHNTLLWLLIIATTAIAQTDTLKLTEQQLDEVVVSAQSANRRISGVQIGAEQLHMNELNSVPALMGERDIMRSVQLLPGVKSESDASSGFQVRGGTASQNLLLFDDVPVYNVCHLAGLFSAFNDDALGGATLYKGLMPSQLGGAVSAVLDMTGRTGSKKKWQGDVGLGLLSAKAAIEGPIVKDKVSMLVTARRSYMDAFLKALPDYRDNQLFFYDMNAKADWQINNNHRLELTLFTCRDKTALKDMVSIEWQNQLARLGWTYTHNDNLTAKTSLYHSNYATDNGFNLHGLDISYSGHIRHTGLNHNTHWVPAKGLEIDAGVQSVLLNVKSAEWQNVTNHEREQRKAWQNDAWLSAEWSPNSFLAAEAGVRLSTLSLLGGPYYYEVNDAGNIVWLYNTNAGNIVYTHFAPNPRLGLRLQLKPTLSVKAGYTRTNQFIHALRNQSTSTPFDRYTLSSNLLKPQLGDQVSLGVFGMTPKQDYDWSIEGYYRHIDHVLDYRDGLSFSSAIEIERLVLAGQGRSYGAELCLRKNTGKLTGWVSYSLSWTDNQIEGINGGQWYTASNDRRHDANVVLMYQLSKSWALNSVWVYNSGQAFTAPSGKYQLIDNYIYYYAERNGYRAPDYHRLDVSATWTKKIAGGRLTREWNFGVYNLYNRMNPYLIYFEDGQNGQRTKATMYSLFGIVPSVTLKISY